MLQNIDQKRQDNTDKEIEAKLYKYMDAYMRVRGC